jgi:peptide/nickel transport system permease protein
MPAEQPGRALHRRARWTALAASGLSVLVLCAIAAPLLSPHDPSTQDLAANLAPPSLEHPLGCDKLGRDQLSRLIHGGRVSLTVGVTSVLASVSLGLLVGAVAGYAGGAIDFWLMRLVDVLLAFPGMLLAIALAAVLGPGLPNVIVALSLVGWTGYARLVRGEVLAIRERDHVEAAIALGVPTSAIVSRHVLPLVTAPLAVQATFGVAAAIVGEASLSFLGLGVQPPTASWGGMINDGRSFLLVAPHLTMYPGIAILLTVLGVHALGDARRDRVARYRN